MKKSTDGSNLISAERLIELNSLSTFERVNAFEGLLYEMRETHKDKHFEETYLKAQYFLDNVNISINSISTLQPTGSILVTAIDTGSYSGVKLLIDNGVSLDIDYNGKTPLEIADDLLKSTDDPFPGSHIFRKSYQDIRDLIAENLQE